MTQYQGINVAGTAIIVAGVDVVKPANPELLVALKSLHLKNGCDGRVYVCFPKKVLASNGTFSVDAVAADAEEYALEPEQEYNREFLSDGKFGPTVVRLRSDIAGTMAGHVTGGYEY